MSLVENLINQISTQGLGGITKPQNFDLNDETFSNILDKQLGLTKDIQQNSIVGQLGMPSGLIIDSIDGTDYAETAHDQMESIGEEFSREEYIHQPLEIKEIDQGDFFSNLLKASTDNNSSFMNFARKQATTSYNVFSKNFVADVNDFVSDITSSL